MNAIAIGASSIAYAICIVAFRKKMIIQQVTFAVIYIAAVTFVENLDIVLPIYFLVSLIPFLRYSLKMKGWTFFLITYLAVYLIIGMLFQNTSRSIVMFISRCWQFVIFFIALENKVPSSDNGVGKTLNIKTILMCILLAELALASYLYLTKRGMYSVVRLTSGAQPITGNLSVVILPIILKFFYGKEIESKDQTRLLICSLLFAVFVGLSGTRGYELVYAFSLFLVILNYVFTMSNSKHAAARFLLFSLLSLVLFGILFIFPTYLERVLTVLRLNKRSVGIRGYENSAGLEFMLNAPFSVKIFGIGMGGKLGNYEAYLNAIYKQFALGMWNQRNYLNDSGALFHNLYMNILCNLGLLGCIVFGVTVIKIWRIIPRMVADRKLKIAYRVFFISFLIMNYYRWSADCGIAIMAVFALMLKASSEERSNDI